MTAVMPPPTTAEEAAANAARRLRRKRRITALYGVLLLSAIVIVVGLIVRAFVGGGRYIQMTALVSRAGDALQDGDEVRFRDVIVGRVVGTGELQGDVTRLHLDIDPAIAPQIPAGVTARPEPTTLFGSQFVELVPPAQPGSGGLVAGMTIPADTGPGTTALQTALADIDSLLAAIHPAQLDVALTNLATALSGQGASLGSLIDNLDAYVRQLTPLTPALQTDITDLADVVQELGADAPDVLGTVANLTTTSQTLTSRQEQLRGLLSGGITLADDLTPFVSANGGRLITVVRDLQPVLGTIDANTAGLSGGILQLDAVARDWTTFLPPHGGARINFLLQHLDAGATTVAALGGPTGKPAADQAFAAELDPATYSAADCPQYPGAAGPNCASAQPAVTSSNADGGSVGPVGSPEEVRAVRAAVAPLLGVPPAQVPAFTDVIVGPVLRGERVVILPSVPTGSAPDHRDIAGAPG